VRLEQLGEMPDETPNRSISSPGLVAADPLGPTVSGGSRWALTSAWEDLSLARRRALLADAIQEVWVFGADVPLDRRVHIVWIGEDPPAPRRRR